MSVRQNSSEMGSVVFAFSGCASLINFQHSKKSLPMRFLESYVTISAQINAGHALMVSTFQVIVENSPNHESFGHS